MLVLKELSQSLVRWSTKCPFSFPKAFFCPTGSGKLNSWVCCNLCYDISKFRLCFVMLQNQQNFLLEGESVDDCGGGYSESVAEMCDELQNGSLPLLILTPNGRDEAGTNRDCFLLNPMAKSPLHMNMFRFLGKFNKLFIIRINFINFLTLICLKYM